MTNKTKTVKQNAEKGKQRGHSRVAQNKKIRSDALREQLKAKEYIRQLIMMANKLNPKAKSGYKPEDVPMVNSRKDIYFRLLDKCLPSLRPVDLAVKFNLPEINNAEDASNALGALMKAVAKGELTPNQARELSSTLEGFVKSLEFVDLERRVKSIEDLGAVS